eukprot:jgi/Botrbrau1/2595/Bobra.145_1s0021.1
MPVSEHLAGLSVKGYRELLKKLRQKKTEESSAAFEDARQTVREYILSRKLPRKPLDPKGAWNRLHSRLLSAKKELKSLKEETTHQLKATYAAVRSGTTGSSGAGDLAEDAKPLSNRAGQVLGSDGLLRVCGRAELILFWIYPRYVL